MVQAERLLASSISAKAPWRRSRCSWRRRLAAPPPWLPLSSSSSSDWRNSMGSCCSWSSALALLCGFTLAVAGARCSRVCQYLFPKIKGRLATSLAENGLGHSQRRTDVLGSLLCQPLCHSLVVHRLGFTLALLWFLSLQTGEGVLGTVTVGVCEPIPASCVETPPQQKSEH